MPSDDSDKDIMTPSEDEMEDNEKPNAKQKKTKKKKTTNGHKDLSATNVGCSSREAYIQTALESSQKSLLSVRERMAELIKTNESLVEQQKEQEKDALEVIAALQSGSEKKDGTIKSLNQQLNDEREAGEAERDRILQQAQKQIGDMSGSLQEKDASLKVVQQEFNVIKDFRKKRQELMKELEVQRAEMMEMDRRHREAIVRMEKKFFEEKIRLQNEANRRISELATRAHKEAVSNLKETTKEIFKENVRMAEALHTHIREGEDLQKHNVALIEQNRNFAEEKSLHDMIVKEKIIQTKSQETTIKDLQKKIVSMENALSHVVREFEHEREVIGKLARKELDEVRKVALQLREKLDKRTQEMRYIKRLAQHVLDQRTDLEKFFMDALEIVRKEINVEREEVRKNAKSEFNKQLRSHFKSKGAAPFPNLKGVVGGKKHLPIDLTEPPESTFLRDSGDKVDVKDLSWGDKEKVLRLLFARMNSATVQHKSALDSDAQSSDVSVQQEFLEDAEEHMSVDILLSMPQETEPILS